jgi:O-antigen ligase
VTFAAQAPTMRGNWASPREVRRPAPVVFAKSQELSILGKVAFASLWLLVFAIPWEDAITIPGIGTSARLIGAVTFALGLLAILEKGTIRRPAAGHLMLALFVLSAAETYLWSLYPEGTLAQTLTYVQLLALAWLIWEIASRAVDQKRLLQAYVLGTLVSGTDTIYRFLAHQESAYQRYAGAKLDANDLGLMIALSIPISYYLLVQTKGLMAWVYRLQLVVAGTTIPLTASRGATLACFVALAIVPLTQNRLTMKQRIALFLTIAILIAGVLIFVPETSWERLATVPGEFEHGTMTGRTVIWKAGWEIFGEHPYLGIGANAFRMIVARVLVEPIRLDDPDSPSPPAHNTFLSVVVEEGVVGFAVFCALLMVLGLSVLGMPSLPRKLWMVCLSVWVVGVSSLTWEMRKPTWFLFGLLIAQSGALVRGVSRSQAQTYLWTPLSSESVPAGANP